MSVSMIQAAASTRKRSADLVERAGAAVAAGSKWTRRARRSIRAARAFLPAESGCIRRSGVRYAYAAETDGTGKSDRRTNGTWAHARVYAQRGVVDLLGNPWLIRELDCRDLAGARAERCLVLENDGVARRLWDYPAKWHELPDAELQLLLER